MGAATRVAVVGLGSTGAFTLRSLARAGVEAVGFEQYTIGHDRGAYGGDTRALRVLYGEGPDYVPLLLRARQLWEEFQFEENTDLFYRNGTMSIAPRDGEWIANAVACAEQFNLPVDVLEPVELRRRFPFYASVADDEGAFYDPLGGVLRTNESIVRAVRSARDAGATVRDWAAVREIVPVANGVEVHTDAGVEVFDRVVVCAGPWASRLTGLDVRAVPIVFSLHVVEDPALNLRSLPPCMHMSRGLSYEMAYTVQPMPDGQLMKYITKISDYFPPQEVAEVSYEELDADVHSVSDATLQQISREVAERMVGVHPDPVRANRLYDSFTYDNHPFLGEVPGMAGVLAVAGGNGHTFKLGPAYGELLADLAVGKEREIPEILSMDRATATAT